VFFKCGKVREGLRGLTGEKGRRARRLALRYKTANLLLGMWLQEVALIEFLKSLAEFVLGVHDYRAIPGDGLLERLAGDEQEADAIIARLKYEFIAAMACGGLEGALC